MTPKNMKHLKQRLIFGSFGIVCLFIAIYLSHHPWIRPAFALATVALISAALWEYYNIATAKGFQPIVPLGLAGSILYMVSSFLIPQATLLPAIILGITFLIVFIYYFAEGSDPFANLAITTFGVVYLVVPLSFAIPINYYFPEDAAQDGRWWLLYLLVITKSTDIGAYFSGKIFGRKKLAPYISPQKTWNGALGGLCTALAASLCFHYAAQTGIAFRLSLWHSIALGATVGVLSQVGDLAESLLKRDAGVKDSNQLPGLGGMLDMVDSLVFTTPLLYFFLRVTTT